MWRELALPDDIAERFLAFTLPIEHTVGLISYHGLHFVDLRHPKRVSTHAEHPKGGKFFDGKKRLLDWDLRTYTTLGLSGGRPILKSKHREVLELQPSNGRLSVSDSTGRISLEYQYDVRSGDWAYATFTNDGAYLLLGAPFIFRAFAGH